MAEPVEGENLDKYGNRKLEDFAYRKDQASPGATKEDQQETYKQGRVTGR